MLPRKESTVAETTVERSTPVATESPRRPWRKPVLEENDYSVIQAATIGTGTDFGIYS